MSKLTHIAMVKNKTDDIITSKLGKACVPSMVASGYAFIVLSVLPFYTMQTGGFIAAALLLIFGLFCVLTTAGITLDIHKKKLNNYYKYFGFIKMNYWRDISHYTSIVVLKTNKVYITYSRSNRALKQESKAYEVYLTEDSKSRRQLVSVFKHAREAVDFSKKIADRLNLNYKSLYRDKEWNE